MTKRVDNYILPEDAFPAHQELFEELHIIWLNNSDTNGAATADDLEK